MQKFGRPTRTSCSILKTRVGAVSLDTWNPSLKEKKKELLAICRNSTGGQTLPSAHGLCLCQVNGLTLDSSQLRSVPRRQYKEFFHRACVLLHFWKVEMLVAFRTTLCQEWRSHFCIISLWTLVMCSEHSTNPTILLAMTAWQVCISVLGLQCPCLEAY